MAWICDVNVLVALMHARHAHSERAVAWLEGRQSPGSVLVCRIAQMGALRILTNPAWLKEEVLGPAEFWRGWDTLMGDDRFAMIGEPSDFEKVWRKVTAAIPKGRIAETDAYFAALAAAAGHAIVTFDRGFSGFKGIEVELL